jgi:NADPH:quinone reductase-like Zn-dependent oxidoreductase
MHGPAFTSLTTLSAIMLFAGVMADAEGQTIRQYQVARDMGNGGLVMKQVAQPAPGPEEILVRVRAVSLNRRDLSIRGRGGMDGRVPISDGAGEVIAVGPGVTRFEVGDRVVGTFFTQWISGRPTDAVMASARGGGVDGMLSEMIVSHEDALVSFPQHLSFEEAATLPCAAVTAWRSLFVNGRVQADDVVLLEGTGGVSIFGLQFAVAAGAKPIITSSSDEKLERARALGAVDTVNYRTRTEWQEDVLALTGGTGVHHVLEVGGRDTLPRALQALAYGGHMAIIGGLTGRASELPLALLPNGAWVTDIYVGSREDFEAMNRFISEHRLRPVIDRAFSFEQAPAAYEYMASGSHLGKIVITL